MSSRALVGSLERVVYDGRDASPERPPVMTVLSEVVPALVFEDAVLHLMIVNLISIYEA